MKNKLFDTSTISSKIIFGIAFVLLALFIFFPLYWMVITALKTPAEAFASKPTFFPKNITLDNFKSVILDSRIQTYLKNSLTVSLLSSALTTIISMYGGYSFSKFRYRGRKSLMTLVMTAQMFPFAILLLTIYVVMQKLGLLNTYIALIVSFVTFTLPIGMWTFKSFFDHIPDSLIEAARVDGAGRMLIIHRIMFPLVIPGAISTAIYGFVWSWNDLLYSLTLVTSPDRRTLAPGLILNYLGEFQSSWTEMMAASIWVSIPVTIMFIFLQRFFIQGMTAGAVKG